MEKTWTSEQKAAIASRQGNFLVSAGAGSGKTAVLAERIRQIVDGGDASLQELLVLTFTDKAAQEMKGRVRDAFLAEGAAQKADGVESADITTFDAFAYSLVRKYHYFLGLPEDLVVCDESFLAVAKRKLLDRILDAHYAAKEPSFLDFVRHYALKDDDVIVSLVLRILAQGELSFDRERFFESCEKTLFSEAAIADSEKAYYRLTNDKLTDLAEAAALYENPALAEGEGAFLAALLGLGDYGRLAAKIVPAVFPSRLAKPSETSSRDKALHKALLASYNGIRNRFRLLGTPEEQKERYRKTQPYVGILVSLARELDSALRAFKKEKAAYSFADIAALARDVAASAEFGPSLKARYKFVMVDEYQDTSDLQESFLASLTQDNLFAVGDVKQSIYGFRNANPSLFLARYEAYRRGQGGTLITLQDNFRSREEVLRGLNGLFGKAMTASLGGVAYDDPSQALRFGNAAAYGASPSPQYQNEVLAFPKENGIAQAETEAKIIAADILSKITIGFGVRHGQKSEPCQYEDFAILISRKRDFPIYERVFAAAKIPLFATEEKDLAGEDVSLAFLSLLRLVRVLGRDPVAEKHGYASLKRSYLYGEKDPEIYADITSGRYLSDPLFAFLKGQQASLLSGGVEAGVHSLLQALPFISNLPLLGEVKSNYEKLLSFENQAALSDRMGLSFAEFEEHFADLKKYEVGLSASSGEEGGKAVRLMSIHAAKGLEFPIVYSPDLSAKPNLSDIHGGFLVDPDLGVLLPATLEEGDPFTYRHFLAKDKAVKAELSERMRLFYVALTRAKEKLVLLQKEEPGVEYEKVGKDTLLRLALDPEKEGEIASAAFRVPQSFADFLALGGGGAFLARHVEAEAPTPLGAKPGANPLAPAPEFRSVEIAPVVRSGVRASKKSLSPADEGALAYGVRLHRLLELADFVSKDVSFIADGKERALIARILALPLFQDLRLARVYKEYAYFDAAAGVQGSLDLLIVYPDRAVIVDYKTRSLDDEAYQKQLSLYKAYIERVFHKPASTWLLSILEGTLREVQ
jgi:ATP-dependent helicase/nuclease subunit A